MSCITIRSLNIKNDCALKNIRDIMVFPEASSPITFDKTAINGEEELKALAILAENSTNRMLVIDKYNESDERTAGENITVSLKYKSDKITGKKYGAVKLMYPLSQAAQRTLNKLNGGSYEVLLIHDSNKISGMRTSDYDTLKTISVSFSFVEEYLDDYPMGALTMSFDVDYEMNKDAVALEDISGEDIPSLTGMYFNAKSQTVASAIFEARDGNGNVLTDGELTIGADGVNQFYIYNNTSAAIQPGAVTYDVGTGYFTFTPTTPFTIADSVKIGYNEPYVTSELYVTEQFITVVIPA